MAALTAPLLQENGPVKVILYIEVPDEWYVYNTRKTCIDQEIQKHEPKKVVPLIPFVPDPAVQTLTQGCFSSELARVLASLHSSSSFSSASSVFSLSCDIASSSSSSSSSAPPPLPSEISLESLMTIEKAGVYSFPVFTPEFLARFLDNIERCEASGKKVYECNHSNLLKV